MPPLADACASFKGFARKEKRADRIFELLLAMIQRHRAAKPKRFYPMRDVAKFFGVSKCTVEVVYRRLTHEGVLTRMRSSQTMIAARTPRPRLAVRGVVSMPIWTRGFIHFRDWRIFFSELEEELSRHRFILEPVFFRQSEETDPAFVDRVLKFNPDYVVWNAPVAADRMTMESITDAGVPILAVTGSKRSALPGRIYRTSYHRALQRGLEEWKASGRIKQVVIPYGEGGNVEGLMENFGAVLQTSPLPHQFKPYKLGRPVSEYLTSLASDRHTGVFFGDELFFIQLCALAAKDMFQLFRRRRVIFNCQVMMQSWTMPADIFVDWLSMPSRRLARRIAQDLSQSKGALPSTEEVFEADWQPRTPLADLVRLDQNE